MVKCRPKSCSILFLVSFVCSIILISLLYIILLMSVCVCVCVRVGVRACGRACVSDHNQNNLFPGNLAFLTQWLFQVASTFAFLFKLFCFNVNICICKRG